MRWQLTWNEHLSFRMERMDLQCYDTLEVRLSSLEQCAMFPQRRTSMNYQPRRGAKHLALVHVHKIM